MRAHRTTRRQILFHFDLLSNDFSVHFASFFKLSSALGFDE